MGLLMVFFAICLYQLADRDDRQAWIWALGYIASSLLLGRILAIGGLADLATFIVALVLMIWTKPIKRDW